MASRQARHFELLLSILNRTGRRIESATEDELTANQDELTYCIDDILLDEFCAMGLNKDCELNEYGLAIEDAISYFNTKRCLKQE